MAHHGTRTGTYKPTVLLYLITGLIFIGLSRPIKGFRLQQATLYDLADPHEIHFHLHIRQESIDDQWLPTHIRYFRPDGHLSTEEWLEFESGEFRQYRYRRHNTGSDVKVTRVGEQLFYQTQINGQIKEKWQPYRAPFLVSPLLLPYIQSQFDQLSSGQAHAIHLAVPGMRRAFVVILQKDLKLSNDDQCVIKVRPKNWLLSVFVDDFQFTLSVDGRHVKEMTGQALPVLEKNGSFVPVIGRFILDSATLN